MDNFGIHSIIRESRERPARRRRFSRLAPEWVSPRLDGSRPRIPKWDRKESPSPDIPPSDHGRRGGNIRYKAGGWRESRKFFSWFYRLRTKKTRRKPRLL